MSVHLRGFDRNLPDQLTFILRYVQSCKLLIRPVGLSVHSFELLGQLLSTPEISEVLFFLFFGSKYSVGQWWSNQWYSIELYIVNPTLG